MANSIALAKGYTNVIDEVYKLESVSNALTSDQGLARPGANAKETVIPKVSVDGLRTHLFAGTHLHHRTNSRTPLRHGPQGRSCLCRGIPQAARHRRPWRPRASRPSSARPW